MALFSLSVKSMNRRTGSSIVAAAAYRSTSVLIDIRDGQVFDFSRKTSVARPSDVFIVAPEGAQWAMDRSKLWNTAEAAENRGNANVAREWLIALPSELGEGERADLACQFATCLVHRFGVVADVAIHRPDRHGDQRNFHAHILTTTREAAADGLGRKTRELDVKTTSSLAIEEMRVAWAGMVNKALEAAGKTATVDHRSFARRGIDRVPTIHIGRNSSAVQRKGRSNPRLDRYKAAVGANAVKKARERAEKGVERPVPEPLEMPDIMLVRAAVRRRRQAIPPVPAPVEVKIKNASRADHLAARPTADAPRRPAINRRAAIDAARIRKAALATIPSPLPLPDPAERKAAIATRLAPQQPRQPPPVQQAEQPAAAPAHPPRQELRPYSAEQFRADNGLRDDWTAIGFYRSYRDRDGWHPRPLGEEVKAQLEAEKIDHTTKTSGWIIVTIDALVRLGQEASRLLLQRIRKARQDHERRVRIEKSQGLGI